MVILPKLYITITFFLSKILILHLHNTNHDTIIRVVCEYPNFFSLISDGTGKMQHYQDCAQ